MPRHIFPSALDWLDGKIKALEAEAAGADPSEAGEAMNKLAGMFRSLIASGIDNDTVQDTFQQEMADDGFFYDLEDGMIEHADPCNWSIDDCQFFLEARLDVDLNVVASDFFAEIVGGKDRIDCWRDHTATRIAEHEDTDK